MRVNKNIQYGMLLCLYIQRAGRARLIDVSENLGLSLSFLEQVARKLLKSKVLKSVRGPGGGYELIDIGVTAFDVFDALSPTFILKDKDWEKLGRSTNVEARALGIFLEFVTQHLGTVLSNPISDINHSLMIAETAALEAADDNGSVN